MELSWSRLVSTVFAWFIAEFPELELYLRGPPSASLGFPREGEGWKKGEA